MKVQDAIAEDKRRGGDGVAVHAGGKHARGRGCDNVLETTPRRGGEFSATRCYEIRELQSDDWEPMTPEPVCDPAPEMCDKERIAALEAEVKQLHGTIQEMTPWPEEAEDLTRLRGIEARLRDDDIVRQVAAQVFVNAYAGQISPAMGMVQAYRAAVLSDSPEATQAPAEEGDKDECR